MTTHILVAIDLGHEDDARDLLLEAARQADVHDAALSVMTVVPDYGTSFVASFFPMGTMKEAIVAANKALHTLVADALPGRQVQHITETGVVYEKVLKTIPRVHADLVIVGAHKPDLADRVQGPNSARIARHAPCSVLVWRR
ncbi:MAG: universal stress protein [Rhodobacteraceae bacterium]|nr:universal stress protein [Paracoccaceae bacterium]